MAGIRLKSIKVRGFRAFGCETQQLDFPSDLAAVWAPNSQGKTSLAEAFEFLFTGQTVRRELAASSRAEFVDALRNAHLESSDQVYVEAEIMAPDNSVHTLRRTLDADYSHQGDCQSSLAIDGANASEDDLLALGVVLSQPPLRAPVLAQHTLGYLFSTAPQERAEYFRAVLEVTDLADFRRQVTELKDELVAPHDEMLSKLEAAAAVSEIKGPIARLCAGAPNAAAIQSVFRDALRLLIESAGEAVPDDDGARYAVVERVLADRRRGAFPVEGFKRNPLGAWTPPSAEVWTALENDGKERARVDEETRKLTALFQQALDLPAVRAAAEDIECPLCGTPHALSVHRIEVIREHVRQSESYRQAETAVAGALEQLDGTLASLLSDSESAVPVFLTWGIASRRRAGFTVKRIRSLLPAETHSLVQPWARSTLRLARLHKKTLAAVSRLRVEIARSRGDLDHIAEVPAIKARIDELASLHGGLAVALNDQLHHERPLVQAINTAADMVSQTTGWQEFLDLARDQAALRSSLVERASRRQVLRELQQAIGAIGRGNQVVLAGKFHQLSSDVQEWWDLLRPGEPTSFSELAPRPNTVRTIDFKAALAPGSDRGESQVRDAVAVFSQSQMHCLGLAIFLARACHEKTGFVVLDDPILSSDEDHRAHFVASAVDRLISSGVQVIILTQSQQAWKDLEHRYLHKSIETFQLSIPDPQRGVVVEPTRNDVASMLTRARQLLPGASADERKHAGGILRDAVERLCKEILVENGKSHGGDVLISNYDGKTLESLIPKVKPLLAKDPSHPGKLQALRSLNPAVHDATVPDDGTLQTALGDLKLLNKTYRKTRGIRTTPPIRSPHDRPPRPLRHLQRQPPDPRSPRARSDPPDASRVPVESCPPLPGASPNAPISSAAD